MGSLVRDTSGNLFGTTASGGASRDGTVFELAAGSGIITTLASFNGTNGANPVASLVWDSSGNLFGTTWGGGASGDGTVFELAAGSGTITTLASFNWTNGANPQAGLVQDSSGNLFGTTAHGGASGDGTVFEVSFTPSITSVSSSTNPFGSRSERDVHSDGDAWFRHVRQRRHDAIRGGWKQLWCAGIAEWGQCHDCGCDVERRHAHDHGQLRR